MNITAITRYKHGELYACLKRLKWTQSELGRRIGVSPGCIGEIINLIKRPTPEQAEKIQTVLGEAGEYFDVLADWPETFEGLKKGFKVEQTADVQLERLIDHPEVLQLPAPEYEVDEDLERRLDDVLSDFSDAEQHIIRGRFWRKETLASLADHFGTSTERIRGIEAKVLRKLRHPVKLKKLLAIEPTQPLCSSSPES